MLGDEKRRETPELFHTFNVEQLIPPNHILRRIDAVLDTSWIRKEVEDCYSKVGRPSWDPEVIVRMILLSYLYGLSEKRLVDEVRMHMGYRWFCHLQPSDNVPDRTTLVKLRNHRWSRDLWARLLEWTVQRCIEEGLVSGRHVSIDGTKIKANASLASLEPIEPPASLQDHLYERLGWERFVPEKPEPPDDDEPTPRGGTNFKGKKLKNDEVRSTTDPEALLYRKNDGEGAQLSFLGNFCIDTKSRVVLGARASQGRTSGEWIAGALILDDAARLLGRQPAIVTADKGYGVIRFYSELEKRGITPHIPPMRSAEQAQLPPSRVLRRKVVTLDKGRTHVDRRRGVHGRNRALHQMHTTGYRISRRLRLRIEHVIGEAKECHGLRRARSRGQQKVDDQVKLTAAILNLKRLASHRPRLLARPALSRAVTHLFSHPLHQLTALSRHLETIFVTILTPRLSAT
jgi:transposase